MILRTQRFLSPLGKPQSALGKLRPFLIPTRHEQKLRVIPEVDGIIGVGFDGFLVEFLGAVVFLANVLEENGVAVEDVSVVRIYSEGSFVEFLGAIMITTNICEEDGVVA